MLIDNLRRQMSVIFLLVALSSCAAPQPTLTPIPTETPSATPLPPTATATAAHRSTATPTLAGPALYEADHFTLYLPATFVGAGSPEALAQIAQDQRDAGRNDLADVIEGRAQSAVFYAIDTNTPNEAFLFTTVNVFIDFHPEVASLDEYLTGYSRGLLQTNGLTILGIEDGLIGGIPGKVIKYQIDVSATFGSPAVLASDEYVIQVDEFILSMLFSTDSREYEARQAVFYASAASFVPK